MKYFIGLLFISLLLSSCQDDDSFTKNVDFKVVNSLENDITGKIYTARGFVNTARLDSIDFTVNAGESVIVAWRKPVMRGDGEFQLYISEDMNTGFGYFTNGVSLDGSFALTVQPDTILVVSMP